MWKKIEQKEKKSDALISGRWRARQSQTNNLSSGFHIGELEYNNKHNEQNVRRVKHSLAEIKHRNCIQNC